jgi:hypothetical protein
MAFGGAMLTAITDRFEIGACQRELERALKERPRKAEILLLGHQGGSFEEMVFHGPGLWYATYRETESEIPRHWNAFGLGKRAEGMQLITVEINPPLQGYEGRVSGLFARDDGERVLLHRGRIGGDRKGIGKRAFREWSRSAWVEVAGPGNVKGEAILIGRLASPDLVDQIKLFVDEVGTFKSEVEAGRVSRRPGPQFASNTFNPEFHGKKKVRRTATIEYECFHGLVVNALAEKLKTSEDHGRTRVFNTREIDLALEIDGRLRRLYEAKSSAEPQAIYAGTGQLFIHALQGPRVSKTLVLPVDEISKRTRGRLSALGIDVLGYRIEARKVIFSPSFKYHQPSRANCRRISSARRSIGCTSRSAVPCHSVEVMEWIKTSKRTQGKRYGRYLRS